VSGRLGVGDQSDAQFDAISKSGVFGSIVSGWILNLPNSRPSGGHLCFEALMNGVPSGFLFLVLPGLPCFLETPKIHAEPLAEQRAHIGCSLLHLTFEAAQESHEARSFSFLSLIGKGVFGVEVGEDMVEVDAGLFNFTFEGQ
jgi:hypothetical protein